MANYMLKMRPPRDEETLFGLNLQELPSELFRKILGLLSFETVSKTRQVSKHFDKQCQELLNLGFKHVEEFHALCTQRMKVQLPRRESERRNHPLAKHVDILGAVETRLSLLSMTFTKYMHMGVCCFIPGKVLDELNSVLHLVEFPTVANSQVPPRPHEVLQELRDISSMAMEYFDEHIVPTLLTRRVIPPVVREAEDVFEAVHMKSLDRVIYRPSRAVQSTSGSLAKTRQEKGSGSAGQQSSPSVSVYRRELSFLKSSYEHVKVKVSQQSKVISEQGKRLDEFGRKMLEYENRQVELLAEVKNLLQSAGVSVPAMALKLSLVEPAAPQQEVTTGLQSSLTGKRKRLPTTVNGVSRRSTFGTDRPTLFQSDDDAQIPSTSRDVEELSQKRRRY